jgi:hypothetical protein
MTIPLGGSSSATARTRTNLGLHHLFAACKSSARLTSIEQENIHQPFGAHWEEILHEALSVAVLTCAALESYANELYFEGQAFDGVLSREASAQLTSLVDRQSVLSKYSFALAIRNGRSLGMHADPMQSAKALIKLRNAVVHFRPEWFGEDADHAKLSRLLNTKFEHSPFLKGEPLFPRAWASADFSRWALRSTVAFLDHFYQVADLPSPLAKFRTRLSEFSGGAL